MPEIEQISVNEAVEADIEHKYWFAHGETPLGGSDFIRPLQVCGDMIECETGNFHDKISISVSEYMKKRQYPLEKVGLWDFTPPGPANHLIRLAHRNPDSVGRRLYEAEAARDAAIAQLSAEARLRGSVEAERDRYKAVVEGLLAWNADSFEDYNPGPNQDSHSTRWVCPVCQTTDEHEDGCPVEAAEQARRSFTNAERQEDTDAK